jgi:hypothetical protein
MSTNSSPLPRHALALFTAVQILPCAALAFALDARPASAAEGTAAGDAAKQAPLDPALRDLRGEWHRAGAGFACRVGPAPKLPPEAIKPEILTRACLHMGPLVVGDEVKTLSAIAPAPHRTLPQQNGATALLYFLDGPDRYPYLVATVQGDRIVALQITGTAPAKGYAFNHIDLGAGTDALIQHFGSPTRLAPSGAKDTDLWVYGPWPFTFEVKDGHVVSIRIFDPTSK